MKSNLTAVIIIVALADFNTDIASAQQPQQSDKAAKEAHIEKHQHNKKSFKDADKADSAELVRERHEERHEKAIEGNANPALRGNEQAEEMRARRDERKAIKEEYRASREPGPEGSGNNDVEPEEGRSGKTKKPWWKFWGD